MEVEFKQRPRQASKLKSVLGRQFAERYKQAVKAYLAIIESVEKKLLLDILEVNNRITPDERKEITKAAIEYQPPHDESNDSLELSELNNLSKFIAGITSKHHLDWHYLHMRWEVPPIGPKPLQMASSKITANGYRQAVKKYALSLCTIDDEILDIISKILLTASSYENDTKQHDCKKAAATTLQNIRCTGTLPHHRVNSLADLLDEGKTNLYPFTQLKFETRETLEELCQVTEFTNSVMEMHTVTDLHDLFYAWGLPPIKGRMHRDFVFTPTKKG